MTMFLLFDASYTIIETLSIYSKFLFKWWLINVLVVFAISFGTTVIGVRCGIILRIYTWILMQVFEWGTQHTVSYEEFDDAQPPKPNTRKERKQWARDAVRRTIDSGIVHREAVETLRLKLKNPGTQDLNIEMELTEPTFISLLVDDTLEFFKAGLETICCDDLNQAMSQQELPCWNFLSRYKDMYAFLPFRLRFFYYLGFMLRYGFLLPVRLLLLIASMIWLAFGAFILNAQKKLNEHERREKAEWIMIKAFRLMGKACSLHATYHGIENMPIKAEIMVCNHTTPFDVVVMFCRCIYSLTGQKHVGMLGFFQEHLSNLSPHLWFERSSTKDRDNVKHMMAQHIEVKENPPILLFPEGVCVNNTAVVMFRKGAFEAVDTIYPAAMRYDAKYCDAFWWQDSWLEHIFDMMTSWCCVVDVYYLPSMSRRENVSAAAFADEVKAEITKAAGLRFLDWDGFLKMYTVKQSRKDEEKSNYSDHLMGRFIKLEARIKQTTDQQNLNSECLQSEQMMFE